MGDEAPPGVECSRQLRIPTNKISTMNIFRKLLQLSRNLRLILVLDKSTPLYKKILFY